MHEAHEVKKHNYKKNRIIQKVRRHKSDLLCYSKKLHDKKTRKKRQLDTKVPVYVKSNDHEEELKRSQKSDKFIQLHILR